MVPDGWTDEEVEKVREWAKSWAGQSLGDEHPAGDQQTILAARYLLAVLDAEQSGGGGSLAEWRWVALDAQDATVLAQSPVPCLTREDAERRLATFRETWAYQPVVTEIESRQVTPWVPAPAEAPVGCRLCGAADASVPHADPPSIPVPDGWADEAVEEVRETAETWLNRPSVVHSCKQAARYLLAVLPPPPEPDRPDAREAATVAPELLAWAERVNSLMVKALTDLQSVLRAAADAAEEGNQT